MQTHGDVKYHGVLGNFCNCGGGEGVKNLVG